MTGVNKQLTTRTERAKEEQLKNKTSDHGGELRGLSAGSGYGLLEETVRFDVTRNLVKRRFSSIIVQFFLIKLL